ncbi:MAG: aminotransferase class V-fold PLP-dependent enzyme [Pontixanthobacter sp.]
MSYCNFAIPIYSPERPIPERIYLDHAATTPLRPQARDAMLEGFAIWANPSSPHGEGRKAKQALEDARSRIKAACDWDGEVIFTGGASEAARIAFDHSNVLHRVVSGVEHDAIHGFTRSVDVDILPVEPDGSISAESLHDATARADRVPDERQNRALAAIQHVNSETSNRQDIETLAQVVHSNQGLILVDCSQSAGKFAIPTMADMAMIAAHKFGGPIGVGALLVKDFAMLAPTGGHERGYRRGTENLPGIMGMAAALECSGETYADADALTRLDQFGAAVRDAGGSWLRDRLSLPTPYIAAMAMPGLSGSAQLMRFDMAGIALSQGSACSSGTLKQSHVLTAMGIDEDTASRTIRVSIGWNTQAQDVERFCTAWIDMAGGK